MTEAEFLSTGYTGLQTGILGITAVFTLVFAYLAGLHLVLRDKSFFTRFAAYFVFIGAFGFLHFFLYSAALFGQQWLDLRLATMGEVDNYYAANSVVLMHQTWITVAAATVFFVTIETFRRKR